MPRQSVSRSSQRVSYSVLGSVSAVSGTTPRKESTLSDLDWDNKKHGGMKDFAGEDAPMTIKVGASNSYEEGE